MRVLVDTSALVALSHGRDQYHRRAAEIAAVSQQRGVAFIGTTLILSEFYSQLLYLRGPGSARVALDYLLADPAHTWLEVDPDLIAEAAEKWLHRFADQAFSLVDAVSFEVMRRHRIHRAFAFDQHFEVAGFERL